MAWLPGFPHANPNSAILVSKLLCYELSRRLFMRTRIRLVEHATVSYTSEVKWPNNLVSVNRKLPSDAIGQTIEEPRQLASGSKYSQKS
jgi:hypothetical protein